MVRRSKSDILFRLFNSRAQTSGILGGSHGDKLSPVLKLLKLGEPLILENLFPDGMKHYVKFQHLYVTGPSESCWNSNR